ncbi:hypothetical protein ACF0H5_018734 [Mactra antiquata]
MYGLGVIASVDIGAVCRPTCKNGGQCVNPNDCDCPDTATGLTCEAFTCSYQRPCYPGDCGSGLADNCECEEGFLFNQTSTGCIEFDPSKDKVKPQVGNNNVTISYIRRLDNRTDYTFILEGQQGDLTEIVWSNQKRFNHLKFYVESVFEPIELPKRPLYVHDSEMGIVETLIETNLTKIPRSGGPIRDEGTFKVYPCSGVSKDFPVSGTATCEIVEERFKTLIEHGDWMHVKIKTKSGGYQQLLNTDLGRNGNRHYYQGLQVIKSFQFMFDFIAPKYCNEEGAWEGCTTDSVMLEVDKEFTKEPIRPRWKGWTDDLSGMWQYYVELFKLNPDPYGRLVETEPVGPKFTATVEHNSSMAYPTITPPAPGMYSLLVEARDVSNNSRITRRFVLYDNVSTIELNDEPDRKLYISSAVEETGYMWQTTASDGNKIRIDVKWMKHFANHFHEDNKLLNEVLDYPIQFKDLEDDGLLSVKKYVASYWDDNEGNRTKSAIQNYHGIVKFEIAKGYTSDDTQPQTAWTVLDPFAEETSFEETLTDGARVRVWVRATDAMGNTRTDSTLMRVDGTGPVISYEGQPGHEIVKNIPLGPYNHSSSLKFISKDGDSGVFKFGIKCIAETPGKPNQTLYEGFEPAMIFDDFSNPACDDVEGKCFVSSQDVKINNCWFSVSKEDLPTSKGIVEITAYNQALLTTTTFINIGSITTLNGLEKYDGPTDFRIHSKDDGGFRVAWTLPEKESCYGRATISIILILGQKPDGTLITQTSYASGTATHLDFFALKPNTKYKMSIGLQAFNGSVLLGERVDLEVTTDPTPEGVSVGVIVGIAVSVIVLVAIAIVVFAILVRRGVIAPPREQVSRIRKTVRRRAQTIYGGLRNNESSSSRHRPDYAYDNRQSELYIYGGMDMSVPHGWDLDRNDITFETLIKTGHFANIYKAKLRGRNDAVVAKTLKENYSTDDELLMKAKINFTGQIVGDHPNVLKFVGAVISDDAMGPFIIYEYCQHGTLKDYLVDNKNHLSIELQENLFRFGLDIAKGMEYLAEKGIVHRRLAARNILLTFVNEVKIFGFGPQPLKDDDGDAEQGKKERIPIKWMAPECMGSTKDATEKSDVWSYAVVLWELFSMGDTPYSGRGRDLPDRLKKGERLSRPEQCDEVWYGVMKKCWEYKPEKRPTFKKVRDELDNLFVAAPGDDYYYYKR